MTSRFPENFWLPDAPVLPESQEADGTTDTRRIPDVAPTPRGSASPPAAPPTSRQSALERFFGHQGRPRAVFIPRGYEQNYAYPLIVWLHGTGGSERDLADVMPQISSRNYMGLSLRGNGPATNGFPVGFRWLHAQPAVERFCGELHDVVCQLRRAFHVHSERIFLAGIGEGASLALSVLLKRPEWFAGAVVLGGGIDSAAPPLRRFRELKGKRVLLAADQGAPRQPGDLPIESLSRLLFSAGVDVSNGAYALPDGLPKILRRIDHWVMDSIAAEG